LPTSVDYHNDSACVVIGWVQSIDYGSSAPAILNPD
jgi:hypothetical protein